MSALKRKQASEKVSANSAKKRQKVESETKENTRNGADQPNIKPVQQKSVLAKEQPAFPRGGAGPLTLIEKKQIRAKASRDAVREAEGGDLFGDRDVKADESNDSDLDLDEVDTKQTFAKKKSKKSKRSKAATETESIHIDSVSHKRLTDGSLLLGRISHISSRDLTIALPNNLVGFVPLNAISKQFSSKIEKALQDDSEAENSEAEEEHGTDLQNHFKIGQMLRVAVRDTSEEAEGKKEHRKRIDLSVEPHLVNRDLNRSMLAQGTTVQAAIVSIEDHGAIVDIGLQDGTTAFLAKKAMPKDLNMTDLVVGSVFLCIVLNTGSKSKAVQLSADLSSNAVAKTASSVDAYLPGTLVEVLLTQVSEEGLAGKVLGLLDVTADTLHSTYFQDKEAFTKKYQVGQKVTGRLIANFPLAEDKKLAFSLLGELVTFSGRVEDRLTLSSIIDRAQVLSVVHGLGIYLSLPSGALGFAHISRISDKSIEILSEVSGPYKIGTEHQARIIDYNAIDGLYVLSLEKSVIEQPFLRLEDVEAGKVVKGTIEKILIGATGVRGLLVKIASGITGFVPNLHLSDVALKNPEKRYREGMSVKTRVLSVDTDRRRLELTMKKTLVNSDQPVWSDWASLEIGASTVGTLVKVEPTGAIVQFYGTVKGRLPVSEMSEAYIKDATEHFKLGQVLTVHVLRLDSERQRLTLTARDPSTITKNDTSALRPGTLVSGVVFEKSSDDLMLRLEPSGTIARLSSEHASDGSEKKRKSALEKIRVGQKMDDVLVLEVKGRQVILSNKGSLRKAAEEGKLLKSFEDLVDNKIVTGFLSNITESRVFVRFAHGITGVINKAQMPDDQAELPDFGLKPYQAVSAKVVQIDYKSATPRFWLSMRADASASTVETSLSVPAKPASEPEIVDPVDESITSYSKLAVGATVKVRITSIKDTQINVEVAKGIQGRVDVSEVFDKIEDIHDRKRPLKEFSNKQLLEVKILGQHDSRSYKFLPLSHRTSKNVVFELSARPSIVSGEQAAVLKMEDMRVGESYLAFVNNVADHSLMVNVSPAVRGRIRQSDVSDDLSLAANMPRNFPIGSALKAKVVSVDVEKNHLDLSAKTGSSTKALSIDDVSAGDIVAGRITKLTDRTIVVQLSDDLVGVVNLIDMADDYNLADPARFQKGEIVRAYVLQVDKPNKRISLSLRPSKILSSGLDIEDPELSLQNAHVGDIRRGFVANVADKGVFITLAHGLTAFVRVTNLSDEYLKEWKDQFQRDQLVQGKITLVDRDSGHIQMSLRKSHVDGTYKPPISFSDLKVGDIVEGKIGKVESFGVFIVVANSENVRGLCHRSEIAEKRIEDVTKLGFSEGDTVKAKVLKVEADQRRVNFGMKASYFGGDVHGDGDDDEEDEDEEMVDSDADEEADDDEGDASDDEGVELDLAALAEQESMDDESEGVAIDLNDDADAMEVDEKPAPAKSLSVGGFDWFGMPSTTKTKRPVEAADDEAQTEKPKKKKKKAEILVDRTGDLDKDGPQSVNDFERLLLSEPDNANLWVQFMAFYIDLGDIDAARDVAEKALKSIGLAQEQAKQFVWVALFNLENTFGDDETLDATLQRACQTNDPEEMHSRLASIYIQSGKHEKADELFQTMMKKFTQNPKLWVNYATFLFDTLEQPARARALLSRALQALPPFTHFETTSKFAQLEFKTKTGVPEEGRTRFQGLINLYPKRVDLFNIMLDLEMNLGPDNADQVRGVFEQVLSRKSLKPAKAKPFFARWAKFERGLGDERRVEEVEGRAAKWVREYQKRDA
ncbi:rRNA biogenesis protein rrp5 [Knufia fluminis]|uniref:rRNA biogenesis protein RRP5 n=1 Tax=Knufia fluminis TaxID=191047 RepID=A0AAN8EHR5_9EURO|nr:rRNA biogenesis protein rrp5 [Knufia fluminis]